MIKLGRTDQGMSLYDKALIQDPQCIEGWLAKGKVLTTQRRFQEAMTCYEEVLVFAPTNEEANKGKNFAQSKWEKLRPDDD
jgi:tetratricopeptide (TPR) repeat protein